MNLTTRIQADILAAMKAREEVRLSVLRMLKTAAKLREVELRRPLTDDEMLAVIAREVKQRRESAEQFAAAGRAELAAKEEREITVLLTYLPAPLSDAELTAAVDTAVTELGAKTLKDMGRVVQSVLAAHRGRADGKRVSAAVKARLTS